MMFSVVMMVVMTGQHMVFDPAPVFDTLVGDNARRPERRAGRDRRGNLHQRMVSRMTAGLQLSAVPDRAEC